MCGSTTVSIHEAPLNQLSLDMTYTIPRHTILAITTRTSDRLVYLHMCKRWSLETTKAEAVGWACTFLGHPFSVHLHIWEFIRAIYKLPLHESSKKLGQTSPSSSPSSHALTSSTAAPLHRAKQSPRRTATPWHMPWPTSCTPKGNRRCRRRHCHQRMIFDLINSGRFRKHNIKEWLNANDSINTKFVTLNNNTNDPFPRIVC
jgi:hypothetical protein